MGKYGESIGIWNITLGGADMNIKPRMGDNDKLRKLMTSNINNTNKLMTDFKTYMIDMIKRDIPPDSDEELEELTMYVEFNLQSLFEEIQIKFKWTTREELSNMKKEQVSDIKKLIEGN